VDDVARSRLKDVVARHGRDLFRNPRIAEVLRENLGPELKLEASLLNAAVQFGLPQRLCALEPSSITPVTLTNFATTMSAATGVKEELANWAARTWADALGVHFPSDVPIAPQQERLASTEPKTDQEKYVSKKGSSLLGSNSLVGALLGIFFISAGVFVSYRYWTASSAKESATTPTSQVSGSPSIQSPKPSIQSPKPTPNSGPQPQVRTPELPAGCFEDATPRPSAIAIGSRYQEFSANILISTSSSFLTKLGPVKQYILGRGGYIAGEWEFPPGTVDFHSYLEVPYPRFINQDIIIFCGSTSEYTNFRRQAVTWNILPP
jgi:hypothetical protein